MLLDRLGNRSNWTDLDPTRNRSNWTDLDPKELDRLVSEIQLLSNDIIQDRGHKFYFQICSTAFLLIFNCAKFNQKFSKVVLSIALT